ncbi:MAG: hypothetical protein PF517_14735 [Salinivirgaceae bacterium]|jgi:hypothetical protein|nr:hypothetical protein [Salinivirgaceae bacterium]
MKKKLFIILLFISVNTFSQKIEKLWETDTVFAVPESVLFDDTVMYVSNVGGESAEKNNLGFISRINDKGEILNLKWVEQLNAPKGMGVLGNKLYVTDIDRVAVIDRVKGKILQFIEVPNSEFLNDISISDKGIVAVSDMNTQTIHLIKKDELVSSIVIDSVKYLNGLYWEDDILLAGISGSMLKVNTELKTSEVYINGIGGIDGLEKIDDSRYIITDWSGKMQLVSPHSAAIELLNKTQDGINAADIGLDRENNVIFIPTFFHKTVSAYKLVE